MIETTEDKTMSINGQDVVCQVTTIDHESFDEEGNPKISVNIKVPAVNLFGNPGQNGE